MRCRGRGRLGVLRGRLGAVSGWEEGGEEGRTGKLGSAGGLVAWWDGGGIWRHDGGGDGDLSSGEFWSIIC